MTSDLLTRRLGLWLTFAVVGVFGGSVGGGYVWDDRVLIEDNPLAHSLSHLRENLTRDFWHTGGGSAEQPSGYYRPVVKVALLLQYVVLGGSPVGFRLVSLTLHIACVLLAFAWLRRRLGPLAAAPGQVATPWQVVVGACAGALVFALHPSRAESVAWISGSTDLWMALLVLGGLWLHERPSAKARLLAGVLFALAFLAKEAAACVPFVLGLDAALRSSPGAPRREALWRVVPVAAIVATTVLLRGLLVPLRTPPIMAAGLQDLALRVLASLGFFALRTVFPWPVSVLSGAVSRSSDGTVTYPMTWVSAGALALVAALALLFWAWARPALRPVVADVAFFLGPLAPVMNLVPLQYNVLASDRFLYLPLLGVAALVARAARRLSGSSSASTSAQIPKVGVAALTVSLAFGLPCALQAHRLGADESLWRHERALRPLHPYAADMLARTLWDADLLEESLSNAAAAVRHAQTDTERVRALALYVYVRQGLTADGDLPRLQALRDALEAVGRGAPEASLTLDAASAKPVARVVVFPARAAPLELQRLVRSRTFRTQLGILRARTGDLRGAEALFRALLREEPGRVALAGNLARVLERQGRHEEAQQVLARFASGPGE